MADPFLAELELERYGDLRRLKREKFAKPLARPLEGPRDWVRRRQILQDCLEGISQDYRRPQRRAPIRPTGVDAGEIHRLPPGPASVKRGRETKTLQRLAA